MNTIRLIVGLGNPGREYEKTRHNVGFWWVDELAHSAKLSFRNEIKFHGLFARGPWESLEFALLKPQTFMNLSGRAVAAVMQFYKILPSEILIVHDELDLQPGVARLKMAGGHGGHNGLKDIIANLGTKDFLRLRLGVGRPIERTEVVNYVLNDPRREERELIDNAMQASLQIAQLIIAGKIDAAMLKLHSQ